VPSRRTQERRGCCLQETAAERENHEAAVQGDECESHPVEEFFVSCAHLLRSTAGRRDAVPQRRCLNSVMPAAHIARTIPTDKSAARTGSRGSQRPRIRAVATVTRKKRLAIPTAPTRNRSKPCSRKKDGNEVAKRVKYALSLCQAGS
jgi:hypothetical protein